MDWKKYTAVIVFIAYIALIIHPFNIPIWIPWIGMTLLFIVIIKFTEISFYLYLKTVMYFTLDIISWEGGLAWDDTELYEFQH